MTSFLQDTYVAEGFATVVILANVRAFTGMSTVVDSKGGTLDELLAAALPLAVVRALTGVDTAVACEVGATGEGLAAIVPRALVGLFAIGRVRAGGRGVKGRVDTVKSTKGERWEGTLLLGSFLGVENAANIHS